MRLYLVILATIIMLPSLFAQPCQITEVIRADGLLNKFLVDGNVHEASKFCMQNFVLNTASGIKHKDELISELESKALVLKISTIDHIDVKIEGTAATLSGILHQRGIYKGKAFDTYSHVTDRWLNTVDGWKIAEGNASQIVKPNEH